MNSTTSINKKSICYYLRYPDGGHFVSKPCLWLEDAIAQSHRSDRPLHAWFYWGKVLTKCAPSAIRRATNAANRRRQRLAA